MALQFPSDINQSADVFLMYPAAFSVSRGQGGVRTTKTLSHSGAITLPTPSSGLSLNESGNWDETEGMQFGADASSLAQASKMMGIKKGVEQGGPLAKLAIKGTFNNDYASMSYSGSNFRTYSFEWDLIPDSLEEAKSIAEIIKKIRQNSLPYYNQALIKYPSMWQVYPAMRAETGMKLKDCVITNFTVNYTPDGVLRRYNSGHPVSVNMSIEFKELYRADGSDA